jgi:hypothetical protein
MPGRPIPRDATSGGVTPGARPPPGRGSPPPVTKSLLDGTPLPLSMPPLLPGQILPGGLSRRRRGRYRFVLDAGFVAGPVGLTAIAEAAGSGAAGMVGALTAGAALLSAAAGGGRRGERRGRPPREATGPTEG